MADEVSKIAGAVEDAVTYPILTKEIGGYTRSSRNGDGAAGDGGSLTRTAQSAIRDLLGWRYRSNDPKGFVAALNKAVDLKQIEGHVESSWKARPFMVQADLGEVTGAQASIYERSRVAVDHALPQLDMLKSLRADADDESTESVRSMVRSSLTELVTELGNVGGPRVQRVNDYFERLLGVPVDPLDKSALKKVVKRPEKVKGILGLLRRRFGLDRRLVLTVDEERNFTNFLILVDYTTSLLQTWVAQRDYVTRNSDRDPFLGTQLVRLSQMLNVIGEQVHEAYDAMDSVNFGAAERAVVEISYDKEPGITVGELLEWVEHFTTIEAPQLIEDSGKDGVREVGVTLARLERLIWAAVKQSQQP
jgi:hypothetical protein